MKLEYTDGCICTSLTVDGKETADMTSEEIKVSIQAMLDREIDFAVLQDIWTTLIESQAELMLQKTFDDFDMDKFVRNHISTQMRYWTTEEVRRQVASLLADRLVILSTDMEKYNKA